MPFIDQSCTSIPAWHFFTRELFRAPSWIFTPALSFGQDGSPLPLRPAVRVTLHSCFATVLRSYLRSSSTPIQSSPPPSCALCYWPASWDGSTGSCHTPPRVPAQRHFSYSLAAVLHIFDSSLSPNLLFTHCLVETTLNSSRPPGDSLSCRETFIFFSFRLLTATMSRSSSFSKRLTVLRDDFYTVSRRLTAAGRVLNYHHELYLRDFSVPSPGGGGGGGGVLRCCLDGGARLKPPSPYPSLRVILAERVPIIRDFS